MPPCSRNTKKCNAETLAPSESSKKRKTEEIVPITPKKAGTGLDLRLKLPEPETYVHRYAIRSMICRAIYDIRCNMQCNIRRDMWHDMRCGTTMQYSATTRYDDAVRRLI